jgi:hypothetical protein
MSNKEMKDLKFVSSYNVFCIKYVKGMCGCRKNRPLLMRLDEPSDIILLHALNRLENEKN